MLSPLLAPAIHVLSGGISEALVTTLAGLIVAVPILLAHAILSRLVERRYARLEQAATLLHGAYPVSASPSDAATAAELPPNMQDKSDA